MHTLVKQYVYALYCPLGLKNASDSCGNCLPASSPTVCTNLQNGQTHQDVHYLIVGSAKCSTLCRMTKYMSMKLKHVELGVTNYDTLLWERSFLFYAHFLSISIKNTFENKIHIAVRRFDN